ncbi:MAG: hypothetical protein IPN76_19735 [Saprospiraceae bacterium]|nr:hypothetical protein [Saprospiraceae bacterium]
MYPASCQFKKKRLHTLHEQTELHRLRPPAPSLGQRPDVDGNLAASKLATYLLDLGCGPGFCTSPNWPIWSATGAR